MALGNVIGQDNALRTLSGTIQRKRVATSYIFTGEQGTGKRFTAVNFIKALNCRRPANRGPIFKDACDRCPSCRKIDSGTHPDFLIIEPEAGQIRVTEIRRLEEVLSFKAYEAGTKAVIVDDAETMNAHAANAFLKTLEEPPPESLIILISSSPDRLPETIRSRCSHVNFTPLPPEACETVIKSQRDKDLSVLVRLSMGRPGLAVREDLVKERDWFMKTLGRTGDKHPWGDRKDMEKWFDMSLLFLRDIAVLKITGSADELINKDLADEMSRISKGAALKVIIECYEKLLRVKNSLGFNLNRGITWNYTTGVLTVLHGD